MHHYADEAKLKGSNNALPSAETIGSIISRLLSGSKWAEQVKDSRIFLIWDSVVGPAIAQHAQPSALRSGKLFVYVDSSAWLAQLDRYLKTSILKRLNEKLGKKVVVKIIFRSGEVKPLPE